MSDEDPPDGGPADTEVPDRFSVDFTGLTLLGTYEVKEKIADGGMGSVYLGQDTNLDRPIVVKVPHVRFLSEPGFRRRFALEISELVRLEHPHVVSILAQGEHEEVPYFVLQFLGGGSLEDVFEAREGGWEPDEYLPWLQTIARTLDFVHARGTVHRDVKPANVLFDEGGHVFLSDFGVAKAMENEDANLTEAGTGIGSPRYMAPEQGYGHDLTPSADQYALASMTYEAAAGRPPFMGESPIELLVKKGGSDPESLCELVPALPAESGAAVMQALSRKPEERHASCVAFVDAFESGLRPAAEPVSSPLRGSLIAALLLAAVLAAILFATRQGGTPPGPSEGAANHVGDMRLTLVDPGVEPRRTLRYTVPAGATEDISLTLRQTSNMTIGGKPFPMAKNPTVQYTLQLRADEVTEGGDIHMSSSTSSVYFTDIGAMRADAGPALEKFKRFLRTFGGTAVLTPNGLTRRSELAGADEVPKAARTQIESLWWVVRNIAMAFPVEPVGVGARWEVTETLDLMGMRVTDTSTYELVKLEGDAFELKMFSAQTAAEQKVTTFDFGEEEMDATLLSLHARGKSTAVSDLAHLSSEDFEFSLIIDMEVMFADMPSEEGGAGDVEAKMHLELTMTVERD